MARFFLKYAKQNVKYILKEDEDNELLVEFLRNVEEMEVDLSSFFDLLKEELNVDGERIEVKRNKRRKRKKKNKKITKRNKIKVLMCLLLLPKKSILCTTKEVQ